MNWSEHELECDLCVDAAAYVLGALDEAQLVAYREHLEQCAVCREEVAELQPVVDELPVAVARIQPPGELRERVLIAARAEAELLRAAGSEADRPIHERSRWRVRPMFGLAGAASALALGLVLGLLVMTGGSGENIRVTTARLARGVHNASAVLRQVGSRSELDVADMPAPPEGRIYEVWLQRGSSAPQPTDALFSVTSTGSGTVNVPGDLHGVSKVLVTDEPLGGSTVPTRMPVIVVTLT